MDANSLGDGKFNGRPCDDAPMQSANGFESQAARALILFLLGLCGVLPFPS